MFTGLIESTGKIKSRTVSGNAGKLVVKADKTLPELKFGESIAVNGVCLTLEQKLADGSLEFHTLEETLNRTNLGQTAVGGSVNLERALKLGDRIGGHMVSGHVDAVAPVISLKKTGSDYELRISLPEQLRPFLVEKGSIAIDGISLTLVDVTENAFSVHLIPVTLEETALKFRKNGDLVNLEVDMIGRYVQKQLSMMKAADKTSKVTLELLEDSGW
ncbi:MAG: riboflavin synthase [Victivallaceae bacterium]|jgi:riboflavin synthase